MPLGAFIGALIAFEMGAVLMTGFRGMEEPKALTVVLDAAGKVVPYSNTKELGKLLYTEYLYPIEIAAVILLVAMITAIGLTLRERKDTKKVDASRQVRVRARDRMEVVKLNATQAPAPVVDVVVAEEPKK